MSDDVVRVEVKSFFEKGDGDPRALWHSCHMRQRSKKEIVSAEAIWAFSPRPFDLRMLQARFDNADHAVCNLILQIEDVFERPVELVGPKMRSVLGLD